MGLLSFLSKNKQDAAGEDSGYYCADDKAATATARSKRASSAAEPAARGSKESRAAADPVLPEKKRARRRLVGSIALALAVAVGLPMILDAEPKQSAGDIDIRIPPKDSAPVQPMPRAVAAADTLDKREEIIEPPALVLAAAPAPATAPVPAKPALTRLEATKPAKDLTNAEPAKALVKADVKPPEKKVAERVADKPADKVAVKPPQEAARATAILEGKPADKPADKPAEKPALANQKFTVQVAALATQEKVTELQERLKAVGLNSYTQKVPTPSGERIRVRVGPFSKDEADSVRAKLSKLGLSGSMVPG